MNEPGISSFDEFLLFYAVAAVLTSAVWVILEAEVLLGPTATAAERRRRQRWLLHVLTVLGVLHPACALAALDLARPDEGVPAADAAGAARIRRRAQATAIAGLGLLAVLCAPHLPVVADLPAVDAIVAAVPWEAA